MAASAGALGKLGIGATSPVTIQLELVNEGFVLREETIYDDGVVGSRSARAERVRAGLQRIAGPIVMRPNSLEWSEILQWILGGTPTGSGTVTYPLADTLPVNYVTIDRVAKVFTYAGVAVDQATIRAQQDTPLEVELQLVGLTETVGAAGSFPSLSLNQTNGPFVFSDAVIVVGGTTITCKDFELVINNMIDKERFFNGLTLVSTVPHDRVVTLRMTIPEGDWYSLYGSGLPSTTVTITLTNGGAALEFNLGAWVFPREAPRIPGRHEIMLNLTGRCYKTGSTNELICTLNIGP